MISKKSKNFLIANKVKSFIFDKKGQGMSINVIIVAVLALIILVVLVAIFTGRIGIFESGLSKQSQTELIAMKLSYGACAPGSASEEKFSADYGKATTPEERQTSKDNFDQEINRCKQYVDSKTVCEAGTGCKWRG